MKSVCLYFQVHQPYRLRAFRLFDISTGKGYFDVPRNREILGRVSRKCYLPASRLLRDLVLESTGDFRITLSFSGVVLEQLEDGAPEALAAFQELVDTGAVEVLSETYHHSLAALSDEEEFVEQVELHDRAVRRLFGTRPTVFRNTELVFSDLLAPIVAEMGFRAALVEGAEHVLGWRSPNFVYESASAPGLRLLPRNYTLSDDIAFRFSERSWSEWPLTASRFASWVASAPGDSTHIFIDFETFGEHQWPETGIFEFLRHLPRELARAGLRTVLPSTLAERRPVGDLSFDRPTSWADVDRDLSAWLGNGMQEAAQRRLYAIGSRVRERGDPLLLDDWRRLTTSDHLYYMCTKWFNDGDVHKYFSPYETPYDAFVAFMNVLQDIEQRLGDSASSAA